MNPNARVMVGIILPNSGKELRVSIQVEECIFRDSLAPLPRTRELYFETQAHAKARHQVHVREQIAATLAKQLAEKIIQLVEREDPQHGYSPNEWAEMNTGF